MPDTLPYSAAPLLALMGLVVYVAISELWLWRGSRHETFHGWALGLTSATFVFLIGRLIQRVAVEHSGAILGLKLQYGSGLCIATLAVGLTQASNGRQPSRRWLGLGVAFTATLAAVTMLTPWVVTNVVASRVNVLGSLQLLPKPGPLVAVLLVAFVVSISVASRELRRAEGTGQQRRRALGPVAWLCGAAAVNDILFSWGILQTLPLLEYTLVAVVVMASFLMDRRVDDLFRNLNAAVDERTAQLREEQAKLVEALAEVSRTEARFRELALATLEGIIVHESGVVLDANEAMARLVGASTSELRGRPLLSLFEESSTPALLPLLSEDARHPVEAELVQASGTVIAVEVVGSSAQRGEQQVGVLAIRDIGDRKRIQGRLVLADRLASVGRLAAGAAHEINNPLTYVIGNLEAAIEDLADATSDEKRTELRQLLTDALDGCQRVALIMRDLRDLARPDDTKLEAVHVSEALKMALKMSQNELRYRAAVVENYEDTPPVLADEKRLGQVFLNLLSNAAHAIPQEDSPGGHRISVSLKLDPTGSRVVIEIEDSGAGIPDSILPKVFDPFFTTKPQGKGMGLGLSICHSIVTSFGGDIALLRRSPRGTIARVTLPVAGHPVVSERSGPHPLRTTSRPGRVLVVDDDLAVARTIARALRKHHVTISGSGEDALSQLALTTFDVVVCDLMMPGMTGMELYDVLGSRAPEIQKRMIFVTGGAFTERAAEFLARIPNPRLDKPIDMKRLRALVEELVG